MSPTQCIGTSVTERGQTARRQEEEKEEDEEEDEEEKEEGKAY